jgi:hypothetical protein
MCAEELQKLTTFAHWKRRHQGLFAMRPRRHSLPSRLRSRMSPRAVGEDEQCPDESHAHARGFGSEDRRLQTVTDAAVVGILARDLVAVDSNGSASTAPGMSTRIYLQLTTGTMSHRVAMMSCPAQSAFDRLNWSPPSPQSGRHSSTRVSSTTGRSVEELAAVA